MTAKEYLKQYEEYDRRARRYKAEYEREAELIDAIRSPSGSDGLPHGNGISRTTEDKAIRLSEKRKEWIKAERAALEKRQEIFELIHDIPGVEGDVLIEKYINLKTWENIAEEQNYTVRGIQYAHGRALLMVAERMK